MKKRTKRGENDKRELAIYQVPPLIQVRKHYGMTDEMKVNELEKEIQEIQSGKAKKIKRGTVKRIKALLAELACSRFAAYCANEDMVLHQMKDMDSVIAVLQKRFYIDNDRSMYETVNIDADYLMAACNWLEELRYWDSNKCNLLMKDDGILRIREAVQKKHPIREWNMQYIISSFYEYKARNSVKRRFVQVKNMNFIGLDPLIFSLKEKTCRDEKEVKIKRALLLGILLHLQSLRSLRYDGAKKEIKVFFEQ